MVKIRLRRVGAKKKPSYRLVVADYARVRHILALLETADTIEDMDLPGLSLHQLKGERKGTYAVKVSGNRRVTFKIIDGDILDVNYEDYH